MQAPLSIAFAVNAEGWPDNLEAVAETEDGEFQKRIDRLVSRVAAGGIDEVVLAMNATLEGQTTAHYLAERLERFPIRLTQLAHGLPVGGELDYLDEGTLAQALRARRPVA